MLTAPIEIWTPTYARTLIARLERENRRKATSAKRRKENEEYIAEINKWLEKELKSKK